MAAGTGSGLERCLYLRQMLQKRNVQCGIGGKVKGNVKTRVLSEGTRDRNGHGPRLKVKREEILEQGIPAASEYATISFRAIR